MVPERIPSTATKPLTMAGGRAGEQGPERSRHGVAEECSQCTECGAHRHGRDLVMKTEAGQWVAAPSSSGVATPQGIHLTPSVAPGQPCPAVLTKPQLSSSGNVPSLRGRMQTGQPHCLARDRMTVIGGLALAVREVCQVGLGTSP